MGAPTTTRDHTAGGVAAPLLVIAAMASAVAGLVHGAAAGSHSGDASQMRLFAVAAALQLGWAALAVARPGRPVAGLGVALNGAMVAAWAVSRAWGLPVIAGLSQAEPVGLQDAIAATAGGLAVVLAAAHLLGAHLPRSLATTPSVAVAAVAILALGVPGMAAEHTHGPSHDHGHGHGEEAGDDHGHDDDGDLAAHDHEADEEHDHDDPIISLSDPRVTDEERAAAQQLIDDTLEGMARFTDVQSVIDAGYISIGDGVTGWEHFINIGHIASGESLDPDAIESVVFKVYPDGTRQLASAMYILPFGQTMDDVPDIAGELTTWHDHQDLCWNGAQVVGRIQADGSCAVGEFRATPPMLHVWLLPHPCGPFAGIEGSHGDGCVHDHDPPAAGGDDEVAARDD
jgi:hypothetical protein